MGDDILLQAQDLGFCRRGDDSDRGEYSEGGEGGEGGEGFIFRHCNIDLHRGDCLHIIGGNGVGKTSLLKILVGLSQGSEGRVLLSVQDILYIGHETALSDELTVWEHLQIWHGLGGKIGDLSSLAEVWFSPAILSRLVGFCSAGEKRRLSLMRLCLSACDLWVLDEPFAALDRDYRQKFLDLLRLHCCSGGGVIMSGHGYDDLGDFGDGDFSHRSFIMGDGIDEGRD